MGANKKKANPIDVYVGSRIRLRRNLMGMSQERLGDELGITFQQIQKYEKGTNRVGASRLQAIARILGVPVAFFFDETAEDTANGGFSEANGAFSVTEFCSSNEGLQLNRAFIAIDDARVRRRVLDLVKALGTQVEA